ncbi:MAG TPA: nucleotidyl transferase AbiEii/AbiGii toxin family protein [Candidatus Dormibacteraeota bacterium]|nr:nucleotidyl transferase AbiEii/AbiGii toxin family protein [Candidatus Dormibacteraeota bacterium]
MRQAIDDRLRRLQRERVASQLSDLQRQFAYDRLLCRIFRTQPNCWVLKGATAMLARSGGLARHSLDVDLYCTLPSLTDAEHALNDCAGVDLGDYFRFALRPGRQMPQAPNACRVATQAYLGATTFAAFNVDLVTGIDLRGTPDEVAPLIPIDLPGLVRANYFVWPITDHIADKLCAMIELHPRQGGHAMPSTRYRDLADLAVFAHSADVDAEQLRRALAAEASRRQVQLPDAVPEPDGPRWRPGYARVAREAPNLVEKDLEAALRTVRGFLDPILSTEAAGSWEHDVLRWSG